MLFLLIIFKILYHIGLEIEIKKKKKKNPSKESLVFSKDYEGEKEGMILYSSL